MADGCQERVSSGDEVTELRRRVAELERENARLREQVRAADGQRYQALLENLNDIVYTTDREGILLSINSAVQRIMGFEPQEIIGTHYSRWMPKGEFGRLEAVRPEILKGQRRVNRVVTSDKEGNERHVEISIGPLVVDGRIEGTQGIVRDITVSHRAEQQVRESEEKLRAIFNATTESILLVGEDGRILAANEIAARRFECSAPALVGRRLSEIAPRLLPPAAFQRREAMIRTVFETGRAAHLEDERAGRDLDAGLYPVFDGNGKITSVAVFAKDVTERRRAEEEIRELQRRIEFILGATKTGLSITDADFNVRFVASPWHKVYGDYRGKKCYQYFRGTDHPCSECGIPAVLATRQAVVHDVLLVREGNRPVQITTIPFQADNGEWLVAEVAADITERTALEQKLRESEQRYRTVVETAGETIAVVDAQGVFQFLNTTAARRLGGQPVDFMGKTLWDLFPQEIADRQMGTIQKVLQTMTGVNTIVPTPVAGELRWYNTTIEPLKGSAGTVPAALVIARDIHEMKTAQQELETYRAKMIRAERLASLGTLSAMVAHKMTQPLTVLRLSVQNALKMLEGVSSPTSVREDLNDGLAEIANMAALIQQFRDFAGRSSEKAVERVSLSTVARKVLRTLEPSAQESRVGLEALDLDDLPPIRACGRDLEQIFFALAQNAIQAADGQRDHLFRIRGVQRGDRVELSFVDDCGGIAPEMRDHLFEPFFTTKPLGTGLGLCVVQHLVAQAGGQVGMDSEWGRGTTFSVTLPIAKT